MARAVVKDVAEIQFGLKNQKSPKKRGGIVVVDADSLHAEIDESEEVAEKSLKAPLAPKRGSDCEALPEGGGAAPVLIQIPPISVNVMQVKIQGLEPLIVHAWSQKSLKQMLGDQMMTKEEKKKAKENRKPKDPKEEFEGAKYIINGKDCFPVTGIKKAMVDVGVALGYSKTTLRQAIFILGDFAEIKHGKCVMREDTVRVGPFGNRKADLRYRPEYRDWSMTIKVRYRTDMIDERSVVALLQNAGFSIGLGEWRPQSTGGASFGTFEVV